MNSLLSVDQVSTWLKLSDQISLTLEQLKELRKKRDVNSAFFDEMKSGKLSKEPKLFANVGRHFVKMKPSDCYKYTEACN